MRRRWKERMPSGQCPRSIGKRRLRRVVRVLILAVLLGAPGLVLAQSQSSNTLQPVKTDYLGPSFLFLPPPFRFARIQEGFREAYYEAALATIRSDETSVYALYLSGLNMIRGFGREGYAWMLAPANVLVGRADNDDGEGYALSYLPKATIAKQVYSEVYEGPAGVMPSKGWCLSIFGDLGLDYQYLALDGDDFKYTLLAWRAEWSIGATGEIYTEKVIVLPYLFTGGVLGGHMEAEIEVRDKKNDRGKDLGMNFPGIALGSDFRFFPFKHDPARFIGVGLMLQRMSKTYSDDNNTSTFLLNFNGSY